MRPRLYTGLLGFGLIISAGCTTFENWRGDQKHKAYLKGADFCGMQYVKPFVGTPFDDLAVSDVLPNKYTIRISDPRIFLAGGEDQIWTSGLSYQRLNIYLDKFGRIEKLDCG